MLTRRLYYDDSFEREFTAKVLACEPAAVPASPEAKAPAWEVILDRTAFYPSSGGQPHDLGRLEAAVGARGMGLQIERGGRHQVGQLVRERSWADCEDGSQANRRIASR